MYFYIYGKTYDSKRKFNQVDKYFALFFWFNKKNIKDEKDIWFSYDFVSSCTYVYF